MQDLNTQAQEVLDQVKGAIARLGIASLEEDLQSIKLKTAAPDLWEDQEMAQSLMKKQSDLDQRITTWRSLEQAFKDVVELSKSDDDELFDELKTQLAANHKKFKALKHELLFSGKYDTKTAIVSIHAGAGGTDAQDWAAMLQRMYFRFSEKNNGKSILIDESSGDEAGIKSTTFEIDLPFAFGKLQGEHGVHRLVRLSPFNSDNLRQTSFAKVEVVPKIDEPDEVAVDEKDLKIDVYRAGGKGGQSVNTTDSAVRITHLPTNIVVAIQNERSQLQNKETAMTILRSKLAQLQNEQHLEDLAGLKGPNEEAAWGNQIRSYVLHPYKQVKDLRTNHLSKDPDAILDGHINGFVDAYLNKNIAN